MIPDIKVKNYADFIKKWANRRLYDTSHDTRGASVGMIQYHCRTQIRLPLDVVIADVFWLPRNASGWKDEKQRRQFYTDAKRVGVQSNPNTKNEWYIVPNSNPDTKKEE